MATTKVVYQDATVSIEMVPALGRFANNTYILRPASGGAVTVIDVPEGADAIVEALGSTPVERIVVTHHHFDHWLGFDIVRAHTPAPVFAGATETNLDATRNIQPLADGATFTVGGATVRAILTPGHTPGSTCFLVGGALITGDTLFPGGPGRTGSPENLQQEIASITSRLYVLPPETLVLPGHGPSTTIGESKAEYAVFASKSHPADLKGDVLWEM
ncbi:MAG: MBL fold metallo-hydrolase [Dehalococcoidia bacterium]|nr:MAG: MBL fold metallo-hydrolase [Dehalococcoidia bacterium]